MKQVVIDPARFDGSRFAARYGLALGAFHARQQGLDTILSYPDSVPDPVPLAPPDTTQRDAIAAILAKRQAGQPYTGADRDAVLDWLIGVRW